MSVLAVSHIAIGVRDLDRALTFYRDVLGLRVDADYQQALTPEQGGELHRGRAIDRRQAWLRWDTGHAVSAITLDELHDPQPAEKIAELYDLGIHHVSLWVDDIDAIIDRARAGGHPVIMPHVSRTEPYGEPPGGHLRSVFLQDPDGNYVQCDQRV